MLHDTLELPDFTGEDSWIGSLRSCAGFSTFGLEISDLTYEDAQDALTRHILQMQYPYLNLTVTRENEILLCCKSCSGM
jgi:hypothetical protein